MILVLFLHLCKTQQRLPAKARRRRRCPRGQPVHCATVYSTGPRRCRVVTGRPPPPPSVSRAGMRLTAVELVFEKIPATVVSPSIPLSLSPASPNTGPTVAGPRGPVSSWPAQAQAGARLLGHGQADAIAALAQQCRAWLAAVSTRQLLSNSSFLSLLGGPSRESTGRAAPPTRRGYFVRS